MLLVDSIQNHQYFNKWLCIHLLEINVCTWVSGYALGRALGIVVNLNCVHWNIDSNVSFMLVGCNFTCTFGIICWNALLCLRLNKSVFGYTTRIIRVCFPIYICFRMFSIYLEVWSFYSYNSWRYYYQYYKQYFLFFSISHGLSLKTWKNLHRVQQHIFIDETWNSGVNNIFIDCTHRKVHQILKHIVFSQKNAAKKKKCMLTAEKTQRNKYYYFIQKNPTQFYYNLF